MFLIAVWKKGVLELIESHEHTIHGYKQQKQLYLYITHLQLYESCASLRLRKADVTIEPPRLTTPINISPLDPQESN